MADSGFTLASKDKEVRDFRIRHGIRCREIAAEMGKRLGTPCVCNVWIPDGSKDLPADRLGHRQILKESLDEIFEKKYDKKHLLDSVESKLFGIGSEAYVVGSHEFYMAYAMTRDVMLCLDAGHFHPTETISDKISSILTFADGLLLHVSRGVRWDSDHVVILNDEVLAIAQEIKRANAFDKGIFWSGLFRCQHQPNFCLGDRNAGSLKSYHVCTARAYRAIKIRRRKGQLWSTPCSYGRI